MKLNEKQIVFLQKKLYHLSKSKFRSSFKLRTKELEYYKRKGRDVIEEHAYKFVRERLAPKVIVNNGRQTPMKGHPVFIAQHATATCCRDCLYKWHHIDKDRELQENEINFIVALIMMWLDYQVYGKIKN